MDKPNGKTTAIEMQMLLDQVREAMPLQIQLQTEFAALLFARYQALIAAGFNATQALEIIKTRGTDL